jgi:hypothetical protein
MPFPGFDARGFLPAFEGQDGTTYDRSPYAATMTEIVSAMGTSTIRRGLLRGLLDYRDLLGRLGYVAGLQFVDGSFVEDIEVREGRAPADIDIFSFLERPINYQRDSALWASAGFPEWENEVANRNLNKQRFGLDTYAIAVDEHGPLGVIMGTIYWYSLFSHKRVTHEWKGFLRVRLDPSDDALARAAL